MYANGLNWERIKRAKIEMEIPVDETIAEIWQAKDDDLQFTAIRTDKQWFIEVASVDKGSNFAPIGNGESEDFDEAFQHCKLALGISQALDKLEES